MALWKTMCTFGHYRVYRDMGGLILGVNTFYRVFCFLKLFLMVGKGLKCKHPLLLELLQLYTLST